MPKIIDVYNQMEKASRELEKMYRTYAIRKSKKGQIPLSITEWIYHNTNKKGGNNGKK